MAWHIHKEYDGSVEMLPDVTQTPLWEPYEQSNCPKSHRQLVKLYDALSRRENYFQFNTPTAFGNPEYSQLVGEVHGILLAMEVDERHRDDKIIIFKENGRVLLTVDKPQKPKSYYEELQDIRRTLNAL
jgi:hypothetical protein